MSKRAAFSKKSEKKVSGASEFKDLYVSMAVSFLIRSLIVDQPRSRYNWSC